MLKFRGIRFPIIISLFILFLVAGTSLAVLLMGIDDAVDFQLGNSVIFIEGTAGGNNELAEVPFTIDFHDDAVPEGNISKLVVKFEYDPAYLTFIDARPAPGWGTLIEDVDYFCVHNELSGIIQFTIYPDLAPNFPVESGAMTLAYFDFKAKCQAQENPTDLIFSSFDEITSESSLDVELTAGGRNSYTPLMIYTTNGSVSTEFYWVKTRGVDAQLQGAIGTQITVPFCFLSNCLIDGITFQMEYDQSNLYFIGVEDWGTYFPAGFTDGTMPMPGDFPIYISLNTGADYDIPPGTGGDFEIFKLRFEVIGDWDGEYSIVRWSANYNDPDREFRVGNGTDGYCVEVTNSLENNPASYWFRASWQYLEEYHAKMESYLVDDNFIWNTAGDEQDIDINIKLCNNFEAGTHQVGYNRAIAAILDPPDILNFNGAAFHQIPGLDVFFGYDYSYISDDTLTFYQYYKALDYTNVLDISACDVGSGIDILNLPFELEDAAVTGFTDEEYALDFASSVSTQPSTFTRVEASLCDKVMLPGDGLDTVAIPFKIASGEFSCLPKSSSTWVVDQEYYIRNSFDLASFRVKVTVSGYHYINSIIPEPGVDVIEWTGNYAIFASNEQWVAAPHPTAFKFAQIHFTGSAPLVAARVDPGPDCYWRTYTSTIAFQDPFMSDLAGDNPLSPTGNLPFLFTSPRNISRSEYICYNPTDPVIEDYKATGEIIPTEFNLYQNYPNPFNPETRIALDLPVASHVRIEIFNILGQHVRTLIDETKVAGSYEITWNATDDAGSKVSSGIYLCKMQTDSYSRSIRMLFMK